MADNVKQLGKRLAALEAALAGMAEVVKTRKVAVVDKNGAERIYLGIHPDGTAQLEVRAMSGGQLVQNAVYVGATNDGDATLHVQGDTRDQWLDANGLQEDHFGKEVGA